MGNEDHSEFHYNFFANYRAIIEYYERLKW